MARIEELLTKVDDPVLRADLEREVAVLKEHIDFGLVFERHIPETVDLLYVAPSVGDLVRHRRESGDALYRVLQFERGTATLTPLDGSFDDGPCPRAIGGGARPYETGRQGRLSPRPQGGRLAHVHIKGSANR